MFNSPIEEIKSRLDIVDIIGSYIKLKKAGANYRALCPFHSEKTPSFFVSPSRQIWHCFGCGEGHSIFDFIMKIEGVEFGDALRILAQKAGVELKPTDPKLKTKRKKSYEICEWATKFFERQLEGSSKGKEARQYLLQRGLTEESIKKWRLGWSPEAWRGLSDFLLSKGYEKKEISKTGLVVRNQKGRYYDRFRARIIFPVFDFNSQIIGFGGRILPGGKKKAGKYVNTPNTVLYNKSKVLYGLHEARVEIRKKDFCSLAEGYIDVILAHQAGILNMVATSGTALTPYHLSILKRYSNNLYLAFDMDFAGDKATKRGIDLAQKRGFDIKIVKLPEGKDPADVISEDPKAFKEMLKDSLSILDFYFQDAFSRFSEETPEGKREISKVLLPVIKRIPNRIEQSSWVQKLAEKLGIKEKDVERELRKVEKSQSPDREVSVSGAQNPVFQKSRQQILEERLMSLLLRSPEYLGLIEKDEELESCFSGEVREIIQEMINSGDKGFEVSRAIEDFKKKKEGSEQLIEILSYLSLKADIENIEEEKILPEIKFCLTRIKSLQLKEKLDEISIQIKKAEANQEPQKVEELTREFAQLSKKIINKG